MKKRMKGEAGHHGDGVFFILPDPAHVDERNLYSWQNVDSLQPYYSRVCTEQPLRLNMTSVFFFLVDWPQSFGCRSKPMGSHFGVGAPPIFGYLF